MENEILPLSKDILKANYGVYSRPVYNKINRFSNLLGESRDWIKFKSYFDPFIEIDLSESTSPNNVMMFTTKDTSWSTNDINMWIGSENRPIYELDSLTDEEGKIYFGTGLSLCKSLSLNSGYNHSISLGFNPKDVGNLGCHSVERIHLHLRCYDYPPDLDSIKPIKWKDMSKYEQLSFYEPFTQIFSDCINNFKSSYYTSCLKLDNTSMSEGVIHIPIDSNYLGNFFIELKEMYKHMKKEYENMLNIFTDKVEDIHTRRYIPYDQETRNKNLEDFISSNTDYSPLSITLLRYIAKHLKGAELHEKSSSSKIKKSSQAHIPKAFSGAISIDYNQSSDSYILNFAPRVITTSCITKTAFGENKPSLITNNVDATDEQKMSLEIYQHNILNDVLQMGFPVNTIKSKLLETA
jgi:hypothetical protein